MIMSDKASWQKWLADPTLVIEIEIGYGTSRLLHSLAKNSPDIRFIGIDRLYDRFFRANYRMLKKEPLQNVVYLHGDGMAFLIDEVPSSRISRIHIYFPTPVPKEDRIFTRQFIDEIYRVLDDGGELRVITDVRAYFNLIAHYLDDIGWRYCNWIPLGISLPDGLLIGTPCEVEFGSRYMLNAIKST
jgi:tRNA G46 methylase TrmB